MDKTPKVRSKTPPLSAYKSPAKVQARTIIEPQRMAFPGIYSHPSEIAAEAASRIAPESPNLKRLFGVNRDDLYEIGKDLRGNLPGTLPGAAANPKGSTAAERVMSDKNVQRILDVNYEAEKYPELVRGMDPWYVMTPYYKRMVELLGPERAAFEYRLQNTLMGMASPGSEVTTEIPRGSAAYFLHKQGRFPEFMQFMGVPATQREAAGVPKDIIDVPGHMYHKTAQALPMDKFLRTGEFTMTTPKVPMYIEASGVPQIGFQTQTPVGDAHWSRAVGLADTRGAKTSKGKEVTPGGSVSNPEMTQLAPWWRDKIAAQLGIESVPAQARTWGAFSGQTGVTTPIGSPKLEMIADKIVETAQRLGVSPETARDMVMTGEARMGKKDGGLVDSAPEEAIKNTITDPQAFRMLDMDLANLALMSQQPPRRMASGGAVQMQHGGKMRVTHGSTTKITPSLARSFDVTSDPAYALKRAGDKMDALNIQGPPVLNNFDVPADKLLRMDETPYSAEQVNAMRKFWSKLPADTNMTGEQIYDLMTQNRQHFDTLMPGITKAAGFAGYQRPATGTGGRDNWFRITNPEHIETVKRKGGIIHMAGGGRPPLRSLDEVPSDEYLKAEIARINAAPTVRANSADETANYARYVAERASQPIEMPARPDYTPGFSVLEKPTYGSEVPGTTPTVDQQRYELTMRGQQEAANKRYRAQQGDALAGMDPTGTLAVTDAARTMGLGMLALPVHAGRSAFHYLQHGNMKDAPTGKDYEELMSPRTAEGAELVEEIGTAGSRIMGAERGFGMHPNLWAHTPPTVAQMRAGLKLHGEKVAPVIKDIGAIANERYLTGKMPGMVAPASPLITWHGTPHNIEGNKFDNAKINSGEGAQAYGYGHYLAEAKKTGEKYAEDLANRDINNQNRLNAHANAQRLVKLNGEPEYAADDIKFVLESNPDHPQKQLLSDTLKFIESGEYKNPLENKGNLYKIDLPDPIIDKMLDWDKPISEQHPAIQDVANQAMLRSENRILDMATQARDAILKISESPKLADWAKKDLIDLAKTVDRIPTISGLDHVYKEVGMIADNLGDLVGHDVYEPFAKIAPKIKDLIFNNVKGINTGRDLYTVLKNTEGGQEKASNYLNSLGVSGIKYFDGNSRADAQGTRNFVVFDPENAKFLEKNGVAIEQPKVTPPKALAPANEQGFYSPTEAAALNLQRKSGNGQAFLNDLMKGENVSSEEISGMGLDTWLKDKKNVTAAEVQDYIAQNKMQLGETVYGQSKPTVAPAVQSTDDFFNFDNLSDQIGDAIDPKNLPKPTKFDQHQLLGGENYREVVITMPPKEGKYRVEPVIEEGYHVDEPTWKIVDNEGKVYRFGYKDTQSAIKSANELNEKINPSYRSSHFDEPNILAHLRMSDRVTDGKKTLLVDEVQSDWHQAGRERGYKTESTVAQKAYRDYAGDLEKRYVEAIREEAPSIYLASDPADLENFVRKTVNQKSLNDMAKALGEQDKYNSLYYDYNLEIGKNRQGVPDAPYKEDWYQLALRRAVKEAIDGGYDRVALPTGARVNERFSLTKHVDEIGYNQTSKQFFSYKDGNPVVFKDNVQPEELKGIVGKEVAQKLLDAPIEKQTQRGAENIQIKSLKGQDLNIGGEGNRKYYDEIYPSYLKKFGKKYGANVGKTTVDVEGAAEPLHYMDITPAMRKEFSTGIHMAKGGKVSFASNVDAMRHELIKAK